MAFSFCNDSYSDLYKDVYGFRPRNTGWNFLTDEEKQKEWDRLLQLLDQVIEDEKRAQNAALASFEERIKDIMVSGKTRREAVMMIAETATRGYHDDVEYADYRLNVPYGTVRKELQ
jgi:predicted Fe-S protein YdhL (DUF1289 family)